MLVTIEEKHILTEYKDTTYVLLLISLLTFDWLDSVLRRIGNISAM